VSPAHDAPLVVRPRRRLLRDGLLAIGLVLAALAAPLLLFAVPNGTGPVVIAAVVIVVVLCALGALDFARASITIRGGMLDKRVFLSRTRRIPLERVSLVHLLHVYPSGSTTAVPQLLAVDADGARLFRMRGQYWSRAAIDRVAAAVHAPIVVAEESLTVAEFHDEWPQAAYWYENRPVLAGVGFAGVLVVAAAIVYGMLVLAGVGVSGG
jgi:hypothetical protein